jgi:hypothetical protein
VSREAGIEKQKFKNKKNPPYASFICLLLKAHIPITKYTKVRITSASISGSVFAGLLPINSTLFRAVTE